MKLTNKRGAGLLLLTSAVALVSLGAMSAQDAQYAGDDVDVDTTRAVLEQWVQTRRIISKEKRDWALSQEVLNDRIDIVQRDIESFREKIAEAEKSIADADQKRLELADQNDQLKTVSDELETGVTRLEALTKGLLVKLPAPISERVKPLSQQIPEDPAETKLGLGDRFANVVGILNEVNKFHREITVTSEVRTLEDGSSAEVTALYVGIGQGYYCTAKEDAAGVGAASEEGWTWRPANDAAAEIARAVAIMQNEEPADFVRLPVRIQSASGQ
jgi:hypothetical protein